MAGPSIFGSENFGGSHQLQEVAVGENEAEDVAEELDGDEGDGKTLNVPVFHYLNSPN